SWISDLITLLKTWDVFPQTIHSLILVISVVAFRSLLILAIRRWSSPSPDEKRRFIIQVKNLTWVILAVGLFAIWAMELRAVAISLVAVAAAIVVSIKEVISCFLGGIYKASSRPFELGDRIEIAGLRGEVIDHGFFSTTLLEIGPFRENQALSGRQV